MKTALATKEIGLGPAVTPVGVAASVAPLASVPGIDCDHLAANSLSLVFEKAFELGEAPGVEPAFGFTSGGFDAAPDIGEVFNNDCSTGLNAVEDRGRKNVVAIPSGALFAPSEASKVPSGRLSTFGLQSTSEAKCPFYNFLHMPIAVKAVVRSDSRPGNPQVDTDSLAARSKLNIRQSDDNVKVKPAFTVNKVGSGRRLASCIPGIFRKEEGHLHSALSGGQTNNFPVPVYFEGVKVIPRRAGNRLRTTYPVPLFVLADCRPHGFTGFLPGLDMQVRYEGRQRIFAVAIGQAVKRVGIAGSLLPGHAADSIKYLGELLNRLIQGFNLFPVRLKQYSYRPVHIQSVPYSTHILQVQRKEVGQFPCQLKQAVPLP